MTKHKLRTPEAGTMSFTMDVMPSQEALDTAVAHNGTCEPKKCWHYVAISAIAEKWSPGYSHHVRVDAGHVNLNYKGWRYIADMPKHVKRGLLLFDKERYDLVRIKEYTLTFRRTTKIVKATAERKKQINAARKRRIAAGSHEAIYKRYPNLKQRVIGFSGIV